MKRKRFKNRRLRDAADDGKSKKMKLMRSLGGVPSAAPRTREGGGMSLVGADANVETGAREGQGVKTGAEDASDKLQLHYWNERKRLKVWEQSWTHAANHEKRANRDDRIPVATMKEEDKHKTNERTKAKVQRPIQ